MSISPAITQRINLIKISAQKRLNPKFAIPIILASTAMFSCIKNQKDNENFETNNNYICSVKPQNSLPNTRLISDISTNNPFIKETSVQHKSKLELDKKEQNWNINYLV